MISVFDALAAGWGDRETVARLTQRRCPSWCSNPGPLTGQTPVLVCCEPVVFRELARSWHDRRTSEDVTEFCHRRELERAAQPPVLEVTVTTPPEGISKAALAALLSGTVASLGSGAVVAGQLDPEPKIVEAHLP